MSGAAGIGGFVEVKHRGFITASVMVAMIMQILDTTIANVALPHMQTSLGAAQDTITWVLTSYIVAMAIATPITGWLSDNIGRKRLFMICVIGFVASSALCGIATSLEEMVLFRIMQGAFGAAMAPLSQSVVMDINPRERQGQAMAIWAAGIMVAPIIGPTIGAWLTDNLSWRWCFYINVPVGAVALAGIYFFMPDTVRRIRRFDFFGFAMLSVAIGAFQFMLDRGEQKDWFESTEILIEAGLFIACGWVFVVHTITAKEPFIEARIFRDRNFSTALVFIFIIGIILLATMALLPPMLQNLFGYPVVTVGMVLAPRGIGTMVSMLAVGRLVRRIDARILVAFGLTLTAYSLWLMTYFSFEMTAWPIIVSGVIQGFGLGFVFIPLSTLAFVTLDPRLRTEGTSLFNLVRNLGSSVGISIMAAMLTRNIATGHASLVSRVTLFNDNLTGAGFAPLSFATPAGWEAAARLDGMITLQAAMIAYLDDFKLMFLITLCAAPLLFLLRYRPAAPSGGAPAAVRASAPPVAVHAD
jgi:DHA2 family multidrug resistance protein